MDNRVVTSPFGQREGGFHHATDYVSKQGSCGVSIKASASGKVSKAIGSHPGNCYEPPPVKTGNSIIDAAKLVAWNFRKYTCQNLKTNFVYIDHDNGTRTAYVHLDKVYVKAGDSVNREQVIGTMGNSGWSTGCHLHFEIWTDKNQSSSRIDPEAVLSQKVSVADLSIQTFKEKYLENIFGEHDTIDWCGYRTKEINSCEVVDGTSALWGSKLIFNPDLGRTLMVRNGILGTYERVCSVLGPPIYTSGVPRDGSGWVNNYIAEVKAATSPQGTGGWVQRFKNGSIYFNNKNWNGYAVYGELEEMYENARGSSGSWGFPMGDPYKEDGAVCQKFEDYAARGNKAHCTSKIIGPTLEEQCEMIRNGDSEYSGEPNNLAYCRSDGLRLPFKASDNVAIEEAYEYRMPNDDQQSTKYKQDCSYDTVEEREKCIMSAPDFDKPDGEHNAIDYVQKEGGVFNVLAATEGQVKSVQKNNNNDALASVTIVSNIHGKNYSIIHTHLNYDDIKKLAIGSTVTQGAFLGRLYSNKSDIWQDDRNIVGYCRLDNSSSESRKGTFGYTNNEKPRCYPSHLDFVVREYKTEFDKNGEYFKGASHDAYGICTVDSGDTDREFYNDARCKAYNYPGNKFNENYLKPKNGPSYKMVLWEGDYQGNIYYAK